MGALGRVSRVAAAVQKAVPAPAAWGSSWVPARWTAPDGKARTGQIPVRVGVAAGQTFRLWVDAAGTPTGPPPGQGLVELDGSASAPVVPRTTAAPGAARDVRSFIGAVPSSGGPGRVSG